MSGFNSSVHGCGKRAYGLAVSVIYWKKVLPESESKLARSSQSNMDNRSNHFNGYASWCSRIVHFVWWDLDMSIQFKVPDGDLRYANVSEIAFGSSRFTLDIPERSGENHEISGAPKSKTIRRAPAFVDNKGQVRSFDFFSVVDDCVRITFRRFQEWQKCINFGRGGLIIYEDLHFVHICYTVATPFQ